MGISWIENVRCPRCGKRGQADVTETGPLEYQYDLVPNGFRAVGDPQHQELYCEACDIAVAP
jgi:hypothetical protein